MGDESPIRFQSAAEPRGTEEQELAFLNHVMQALTSTLDLDEVLTRVLERGWTLQQDLQSNLPL